MATMYAGGPDTYATRYPVEWATFPTFMQDCLAATDPPPSPLAMSLICAGLMAVPVIGMMAAPSLGEYQSYYAAGYNSNPPGSYTDTPLVPTPPVGWEPTTEPTNADSAMLRIIYDNLVLTYNEAAAAHAAADLVLDRLPLGGGGNKIASQRDTNILLSALYYLAQMPIAYALTIDDVDILQAIDNSQQALDELIDAHDANLNGARNDIAAIANDVDGLVTSVADVHTDIAAIEPGGGGPGGWPGLASVTLSDPHNWNAPLELAHTMDGCLVHISSEPSGTGKHEVGTKTSWQHAGWLAFVSDNGDADELQWLNVNDACYVPKRMSVVGGVLLFPRAGSSGTLTPWTKNP